MMEVFRENYDTMSTNKYFFFLKYLKIYFKNKIIRRFSFILYFLYT